MNDQNKRTASTVKITDELYYKFKTLALKEKLTLQSFAERAIKCYINNENFRNIINNYNPTDIIEHLNNSDEGLPNSLNHIPFKLSPLPQNLNK